MKVGGNQKERDRDGLIRKEGARENNNRGPTSPRIVTMLNALFDLRCSYHAGCKAFALLSFLWGARSHLDFYGYRPKSD